MALGFSHRTDAPSASALGASPRLAQTLSASLADSRRAPPDPSRLRRYVLGVSLLGLSVLVAVGTFGLQAKVFASPVFWLFGLFMMVGELAPITIARGNDAEEITTSTTFSFALMMSLGTTAAVVATVGASAISDLVRKKPLWKVVFNVSQYCLVTAAAGFVYWALGGDARLGAADLVPFSVAAGLRFGLNNTFMGIGIALYEGGSIPGYLKRDLKFQAVTASMLLSMAPVVVVVSDRSLLFVPFFALPVAAVHIATKMSLENSQLVDQLRESLAGLRELNDLKDQFIAVVSHELRTPLTSVQGYVKTLLRPDVQWSEVDRRLFLETVDRQGDRLRQLIEQLLIVSRVEARAIPLSLSEISVEQIVRLAADELQGAQHLDRIRVEAAPHVPFVRSDEMKVQQILSNLLDNALKYSPPTSPVTVTLSPSKGAVLISVKDAGSGIPLSARDKIFDRFYQVDQSSTRTVGGLGLGLYICGELAKSIGARVWLERSDETGSTFCLWLPSADAQRQEGPSIELARAQGA